MIFAIKKELFQMNFTEKARIFFDVIFISINKLTVKYHVCNKKLQTKIWEHFPYLNGVEYVPINFIIFCSNGLLNIPILLYATVLNQEKSSGFKNMSLLIWK